MNPPLWRYAISDRNCGEPDGGASLVRQAARLAQEGIQFFQVREKDLSAGELVSLTRRLLAAIGHCPMRLLVNGRADVAMAAGAHGVHLTSHPEELTAAQVRRLYIQAGLPVPLVTASCHTLEDVRRRRLESVDAILFGPVFEKVVGAQRQTEGSGLLILKEACEEAGQVPVLALGGITAVNIQICLEAGATGIAGIRLFQ